MKKLLYIILFCFPWIAQGQQQEVFSNFLMSDYFYNPAIAGSKKVDIAQINYHHQWAGFKKAPINIAANFSGSVNQKGVHGYGATFLNSSSGLMNSTGIYLNYAYHLKLNDSLKLGFGIQPGFVQYRLRLYDAVLADEGDPVLSGAVYNANALDINTGLHLYSRKFFAMISMQHAFTNVLKFTSFNPNLKYHFTGVFGYNFFLKKKPLTIQPSILLKYARPTPIQVSTMVNLKIKEKYDVGVFWKSNDMIGLTLGATFFERLTVNYSFEYGLGKFRKFNSGSHEIGLRFIVTKKTKSLEDQDEKLNKSILEEMNKKSKNK